MKKTAKTMKKKKDWQTKEMKRKHKEQDKGVLGVMLIMKHFFRHLTESMSFSLAHLQRFRLWKPL